MDSSDQEKLRSFFVLIAICRNLINNHCFVFPFGWAGKKIGYLINEANSIINHYSVFWILHFSFLCSQTDCLLSTTTFGLDLSLFCYWRLISVAIFKSSPI